MLKTFTYTFLTKKTKNCTQNTVEIFFSLNIKDRLILKQDSMYFYIVTFSIKHDKVILKYREKV